MGAIFLAHGGATAGEQNVRGTARAVAVGHEHLARGASLLDAVVEACRAMEDDGGYNAGRGSHLRLDGKTVEMDAACMTDDGKFGAVVCVSDIRNPILAARRVYDTPHMSLVGEGATSFARLLGLPAREPPSREAVAQARAARESVATHGVAMETGWRLESILEHWNYEGPVPADLSGSRGSQGYEGSEGSEVSDGSDTVGVVATDGRSFAAAASTGGLAITLRGRASDVGMLGAGIYVGPAGAVACTGRGEYLATTLFSHGIHERMARGMAAQEAVDAALATVPKDILTGAIAVGKAALGNASMGAAGNCSMPWSAQ